VSSFITTTSIITIKIRHNSIAQGRALSSG
jgi:hypothetical protein